MYTRLWVNFPKETPQSQVAFIRAEDVGTEYFAGDGSWFWEFFKNHELILPPQS